MAKKRIAVKSKLKQDLGGMQAADQKDAIEKKNSSFAFFVGIMQHKHPEPIYNVGTAQMKFSARTGIFAAFGPVVWTGASGVLVIWVAALWFHRTGTTPYAPGVMPISLSSSGLSPNPAIAKFHTTIEPILRDRCYDCHTGKDNHTPLAFEALTRDETILKNPETWLKVLKNTRSHVMPPVGEDAPTPQEQAALEDWIEYGAFGVDRKTLDPGRQTIRRLNRTEYHNTVEDLLGVSFDVENQFPADDIGYGFDNIGDVLNVSPMLMEKFVQAAQSIVAQAVPLKSKIMPVQAVPGNRFSDAAPNPGGRNRGGLDLSFFKDAKVTHTFKVPAEGDYRIALDWNVKGGFDFVAAHCSITYSDESKDLSTTEFAWHDDFTGTDQLAVHWSAGDHPFSISVHPTAARPPKAPEVSFRVLKVELQGPGDEALWTPAPAYQRFFPRGEAPTDPIARGAYAREIISAFANRAFRRPAGSQTVDRLVDIVQSVSAAPGGTFEQGVAQAMVAILASPRFLYRVESPQFSDSDHTFVDSDEYSLASRLSYFLWSTMPDDVLLDLAAKGQLRKNLRAQVDRMLADPRSQALVENFTGQWLQSREVLSVPINARDVMLREGIDLGRGAQLQNSIRTALQQEPEACFAYIMRNDRSIKEFLDSDYVFMNQTLAQFYHIPNVSGSQMRKVTLDAGDMRGGVITMGATLIVTSNPTRTSPVKRGKWLLENILGAPAPPPPPDIPPLESAATQLKNPKPTLRQILATHRASPQCASCHNRMDPPGLALENFNAESLYRTKEFDQPIDPSGQLYTGESFKDVRELKHVLVQNHLPEFYRCLTEKLLTYATGRGMEYYDLPTIDRIVNDLAKSDGRFSVLLDGVINSAPFQQQRAVKTRTFSEDIR